MYDARDEANEFVGDNLAEASAKAADFYGVAEADLKIVEPEAGEVYGVGGRVVIVAEPAGRPKRPPREDRSEGRGDRDRGRGDRDRGRGDRDRGGRDRGRDRGGRARGGGERDRDRNSDRGSRSRTETHDSEEESSRPEAPEGGSQATVEGSVGPVGDFIVGVLERMNVGHFSISEATEGDFLIYQVSGDAAGELGRGEGRSSDALQLLANQVSMRSGDDAPRVVVDIEGESERREDMLGRLAGRAAKRASDTGRSVALDPMNGRDRRAIHVALRDSEDMATMSIGEGRYRQVLVVPKDAPEYDEAVEASQDADG